ncbi:MAG: cupin domain-containing protein [Gammaproteobacteria bacterium]|nr:cupin domain-containing protein [Gammaproteobacteria bacterium]
MSEIRVIDISEAEVYEDTALVSRRLIRRQHGSHNMSFNVSTLHEGYDDQNVVYPDHDEIVYLLSGRVEFTVDGKTQVLSAGKAIFVPRGQRYGYKVTTGPNEVVAVFSPAKA